MAAPSPTMAANDADVQADRRATIVDLTAFDSRRVETRYTAERIVAWLRASGGTLGERAMKYAAADLIEREVGGRAS